MGHRVGWLTLGAGIAGGADVILIPEIPYSVERIAKAIRRRSHLGTNFSIVAIAEGALSREYAARFREAKARKARARSRTALQQASAELAELDRHHAGNTLRLSHRLEKLTGLECRVSILGYVQRGGRPSAVDRLLATRLGTACAELIQEHVFGVMVGARGDGAQPVPLDQVAGNRKSVPLDHPWIAAARAVGTCLGD
jgi:6-phosphofructokinase 1